MPALPVIANVFRVAMRWNLPALAVSHNVMHFRGNPGSVSGLNTALQGSMVAGMWGALSSFAAIDEVDIIPLDGNSATQTFVWAPNAKWTGGMATESVIAPAVLVKHQTGLRGRNRRGRSYLGLVAEGSVATGTVTAGLVTSMQTGWDSFLANMVAAGYVPVVASYTAIIATALSQYSVESALGTQRRRQNRVRRALGL